MDSKNKEKQIKNKSLKADKFVKKKRIESDPETF